MNRNMYCEKFLKLKVVRNILGENYILSDPQKIGLLAYFDLYGYRESGDHYPRLANFISQGHTEYIASEKELLKHARMSESYFCLLYGDKNGKDRWDNNMQVIKDCLPSRIIYWTNLGYTHSEAEKLVINHQKKAAKAARLACNGKEREFSVRCIECWIKKGYDEDTAVTFVAKVQIRGLLYFIEKYGITEGRNRYLLSCERKKATWAKKSQEERSAHYLKTLPRSFNPRGQEMQAIELFLQQNNIDAANCMFGTPIDQFYQWIPDIGFRRYDLAVFADKNKKELSCIMEFHGPGHINFSDYTAELSNNIIEINGKALPHLGTYGDSFRNDHAKRNYIIENYPNCGYYVFWNKDLKNKEFRIL